MRVARQRTAAIAALSCLIVSLACSDLSSPSPIGKLSARVIDSNGVGVQGVAADLYRYIEGGAIRWRASLTSSDGTAVFGASDGGVVTGNYYIHVSFITNHQLAPGETNDKQVAVREGDDIVVTFQAVAKSGGSAGP